MVVLVRVMELMVVDVAVLVVVVENEIHECSGRWWATGLAG